MVFILVLLTFAAFITYDVIRHHGLVEETAGEAAPKEAASIKRHAAAGHRGEIIVPKGLYYHQGHTWAKLLNEDTVEIGIDDFAQKFMGEIEEIDLPKAGMKVQQGEPAIIIKKDHRTLKLVAPVTGKVVQVNDHVEMDPDIINESPYEDGWIAKIRPTSLKDNLRNLFDGGFAQKWMKLLKHTFMTKYANDYALAMQDGGELAPGFGMSLNDEQWKEITEEFFKNY